MINNRYYYQTAGVMQDICVERCEVKNNGIRIGSAKCKECENCVTFNTDDGWIECQKIALAIKKTKNNNSL